MKKLPENFAVSKIVFIFATIYLLNGGLIRSYATGFFYVLKQTIYGFVPPCGALMRPLLLSVDQRAGRNRFFIPAQTNSCM